MPPERLVALLKERSVRWGRFTLASGRESDFYVDARLTTLHAEGASLVAAAVRERLLPGVVAVGGPVTGADPITGAVVAASHGSERPLVGFMVRKEPKGHGTRQWVEGIAHLEPGTRACMLEDTVTTGGSVVRAIEHARAAGLDVVQCIVVVDREEGAEERIAATGVAYEALVRRRDLA